MSEGANSEQEQTQREIDSVVRMTRWEKFEFWLSPVFWASSMGALFLVSVFCVVGTVLIVLLHFQIAIHHPDRLKFIGTYLAYLAAAVAISGAVLIYPIKVFCKMARRKKESRSLYPSGEELIARRYRSKHPPVWQKVLIVLFFCLIAFGVTRGVWAEPGRHLIISMSVPALFWLVTAMVAVDAFRPLPGRQWTGFVGFGAFGAIAVLGVIAIVRSGDHKAAHWTVPILFGALSVFGAITTVQEGKRSFALRQRVMSLKG